MHTIECEVLVIGGGATGTSILRDLSMRGVRSCLVERNVLGSGATSRSHHNLVSGMRYVVKDPEVAVECARENKILSKIAPEILSPVRNYFVGFRKDAYTDTALKSAKKMGINFRLIKPNVAFSEIPALNRNIDLIIETNDRNIDVKEFCRLNCVSAVKRGSTLLEHTSIDFIEKINRGYLVHTNRGVIKAYKIVNATGAWANEIAYKVGIKLPLLYSQGTIIILRTLSPRGLQRLHMPSDADAYIVHGNFAWLGTTSTTISSPDEVRPEPWAGDYLKEKFSSILPDIVRQRIVGTFAGVRPLLRVKKTLNGREQSRSFRILENPDGVYHIIGGKLTIARLMAEKVSDKICQEIGTCTNCITAELPIGS